jgi:hypothetical protein
LDFKVLVRLRKSTPLRPKFLPIPVHFSTKAFKFIFPLDLIDACGGTSHYVETEIAQRDSRKLVIA